MIVMEIIKSKWFLFVGIPLIVLVVLYILGKKSVHAEIVINATPEKVWSVLMDKSAYREWNTVLIPVKGDLEIGTKVDYEFYQDENSSYTISSKVLAVEENKLLNQGGGAFGVLTFNHKYILEETEDSTKVIIHEDYRGIGVPFWNPAPVEKAYERLCEDLMNRVETLKGE
ncbi:SRPBCC domain-containing protein [Puteibacter caeruleilacunae]|nr:SRPBCC domain-containing protein [Puteibacter caeruleilacunae]